MKPENLFEAIPEQLPEELMTVLLDKPTLRIERILSRGHRSSVGFWYEQSEHEWVLLVQGEAVLTFEAGDRRVALKAGDWLNIEAGCRHRVEQTSRDPEAIWLAVFYQPGL